MLTPDGAGLDAAQGVNLAVRNLTMAYLIGADLTNASAYFTNLTSADLSQSNLAHTNIAYATLTEANLAGANISGAILYHLTGFTATQLYSTASYQARDLTGVQLYWNDLSGWSFAGQKLTGANFGDTSFCCTTYPAAVLAGADFTAANLRGASFLGADLHEANFTAANIEGANFNRSEWLIGTGISLAQLYSTASFQHHDLNGIGLYGNNLTGANFADQNLTGADFTIATLTDADFTGADVRGTRFDSYINGPAVSLAQLYSTASYKASDLSGISLRENDLSGANFAGQNLSDAGFSRAILTQTDFTGADVRGAHFDRYKTGQFAFRGTGIAPAQLYSTASYQSRDLSGIGLGANDLSGANFAGQNLSNGIFGYAAGFDEANLTGANLTAADARGAVGLVLTGAVTTNLIRGDGHIAGLDLSADQRLVVRDYDGVDTTWYRSEIKTLPVVIDQYAIIGAGGALHMEFDGDDWGSTISFAPRIAVALGGTLELTFADDVNLASQLGRTFDLFDWTGVNPTGGFSVVSPYTWDLSNLYTTGEVTLTAIPEPSSRIAFVVGVLLAFALRPRSWFVLR
jgi:uncharacterized protein YjbI with pentapeptide repeats